jgi:hypothetical protein
MGGTAGHSFDGAIRQPCRRLCHADGTARVYGWVMNASPSSETHVLAAFDRLARVKARPSLVEHAVRSAVREAIAWRIGGGSAPSTAAFVGAAIAAARPALHAAGADASEYTRTLTAVQRVAHRFIASSLGRRLMNVPASRLAQPPYAVRGADVLVRDGARRLHAIVVTARPSTFDAGRAATLIAETTPLASADRLTPLTVHVFSLATGRRRTFQRHATAQLPIARAA